ncbi:MAG: WG repeat-containing protein [Flavobacteriales bacterium]|nr:WG repeat-containing protein [Flavobacteriales bacterium]
MTSTTLLVNGVLAVAVVAVLVSCRGKSRERSDKDIFEDVLNDPRVNGREVGEREGIEFFQVMKDGKTGFRDLDGNVVIEPKYESAAMFAEGLSAVTLTKGRLDGLHQHERRNGHPTNLRVCWELWQRTRIIQSERPLWLYRPHRERGHPTAVCLGRRVLRRILCCAGLSRSACFH